MTTRISPRPCARHSISADAQVTAHPRHVHLIEPGPLGHGPLWLNYLLDALLPCIPRITLTHPALAPYEPLAERAAASDGRLRLRPIPWRSDKRSWPDTLHGGRDLNADLTLLTFVDVIIKKARGDLRRQLGDEIWGIWYLPNPRRELPRWNWRRLISGQVRGAYRDQRVLRQVPDWLSGLFVLDPLLAERISPRPGLAIEVLPDPWPLGNAAEQRTARERLGLPPDEKVFLHFGVANPRKGLRDAIAAWSRLGPDAPLLLRAGMTRTDETEAFQPLVDSGRGLLHDWRIPDEQLGDYFAACDWVLLPYRRHEGSSGLLAAAAAAGRPVLAADYGVIGARVRQAVLGLLHAHASPGALAQAVRDACETPPERFRPALAAYARQHTPERFGEALRAAWSLAPLADQE